MGDAADDAYRRAEQELEDGDAYDEMERTLTSTGLPLWETGDDGLLNYLGITTPCCVSCQYDFADDMPFAGTSVEIKVGEGWEEILTCCLHADEIRDKLRSRGYEIL